MENFNRRSGSSINYLVVQKFAGIDLHPQAISNHEMGLVFEELIRRFAESANDTAGEYFTPRDAEYYQALQEGTRQSNSAPFIAFMLRMILDTVTTSTPEATPEVRLLLVFTGKMSRQQL